MNKREAHYHAVEFAIALLRAEVDMSDEMYEEWGEDATKVHDALEGFIDQLSDKLARMTPPRERTTDASER